MKLVALRYRNAQMDTGEQFNWSFSHHHELEVPVFSPLKEIKKMKIHLGCTRENSLHFIFGYIEGIAPLSKPSWWDNKKVRSLPFANFLAGVDGERYIDVMSEFIVLPDIFSKQELLKVGLCWEKEIEKYRWNFGWDVFHPKIIEIKSKILSEFKLG